MAQLNKLIKERGRVKGHMTRTEAAFAGNQQMTVSEAQVRLRKLEEYWHEFQQVQKKIDDQAPEDAEELAAYEESNEAERGQFEQKYFAVAAQAQTIIENARIQLEEQRRRRDEEVYVNHQQQPGLSGQNQIRIEKHTEARLPEIKLTEFDGDWTKWLFFKNSFKTSVIENQKLSKMLKHQYLISVLKGEALKVIEGFEISEENFPIVWQLLEDTYSNEMMIMESHLEQLVNLPSISSDDKAQSIKTLIWHIQTHSQSLKVLGQPVDQWDSVIIHLAKKKLDYSEQKEWQEKIKDKTPDNMPKLAEFIKFLTERCHTLRILNQTVDNSNAAGTENTMKPGAKKGRRTDSRVLLAATLIPCKNCDGGHHISRCDEFLKLNTTERKRRVIEKKLCLNCLKPGHLARDCASSTCRNCGGKHNTLLHEDKLKGPDNREYTATVTCCTEAETPKTPMSFYCVRKPSSQVILSTAQVNVYDSRGTKLSCRALLDPGSQINLITEELMKKLELPHIRETRMVSGINQVQTIAGKVISIKLESKDSSFKSEIECLVLPSITEKIPQARFDKNKVMVPKDIKLADPSFNVPGNIDLLIGAGLYWRIINGGPRNDTGQPAWQSTKLGWIVGGEIMDTGTGINTACFKVTNSELQQQLERFWVQETLPEIRHYTKEEEYCETLFVETLQRNTDGRFVAKLPLRTEVILGESRQRALRRLQSVERRFHKNPELAQAYTEFMEDYMRQGHMSLITETALLQSDEVYFIPHQPVIRPDSITTKLRVVFDASAKTSQGTSLNDKLMPGPNIQGDLFEIILRFRTHEIVLTGDITQMYRQIIVHPNDRKYQLILWRQKSSEKEKIYQLNTVTYGTACAPFHALRCLKELAERHEQQYPMAAEAIQKDFYMDDCLSGRRTVKEVKELQHELAQLLLQGKFVMRKWRTNAPELVQELGQLHQDDELLVLDKEEAIKTLGLYWNSRQDVLQYQVDLPAPSENTKRSILSRISQIFDPLGLVAPILINGKLFMQKLWSINIDWDDQLPDDYLMQWNNYYSALPKLNDLIINRNVNPRNKSKQIDIYGFDDASEKAYGACIYIVSENQQGEVEAHLLCTKSKVAPLKSVSVPGLELEAALLLSKLVQTVKSALSDKIANIYLWSDSTIVLGWIQTEPSKLKTFVGNRVAKIQQKTEGSIWNHVQSQENPADFISRGLTAENLIDNQLWWHGPSWISSPSRQPNTIQLPDTELPEMKINNLSHLTIWSTRIMKSASSFSKLCKTLAICYQFIDNCRKKRRTRKLSTYARNSDENRVLMWVQEEAFSNELHYLINNQDLPKKSPLRALKAFVGEGGLIRVGGRLHNAELHYNEKHQILLPSKHHITRLIMREEHVRLKHCPPEQLLHSLRARYWPIHGRREAQVTVRHCIPCFKFSPQIPETLMGDLPEERVKANSRAFSTTGVDYAGPFQIRESKRRGRIHISKGYVAVFVCLTTKAIHLELVSELTTECFLAALHRFTARRGICSKIFSDNGTNFIGASRELKNIYEFLLKEEDVIAANLEKQRIEWSFIPPRGPHFGGLWEAGVKVMKRHLMTVTQGKVFTFEEYYTLLTAIEAIMNSRPLTPLSNDAHDYSALTPSHFLIGDSLLQPVQHNFSEVSESRLSRWEHLQKLRQLLWKRWQREYLQELQRRNKWQDPSINIIVDTLVLLIEDHVSPLRWPMGRVVAVHPGQDGIVRVVTLRTATGTFKRPVKKPILYYIVENDESIDENDFCGLILQNQGCNVLPPRYNWTIDIDNNSPIPINVQASDETIKILQVTDIHYDPLYESNGNAGCDEPTCCRKGQNNPDGNKILAGFWGDYNNCDVPWHAVLDALDEMKTRHGNADFIYFTGDIIDHGVWETSRKTNTKSLLKIFRKIKETFGRKPIYPILGNHEPHPLNQFSPNDIADETLSTNWLYKLLADIWIDAEWLPESTRETIHLGGYYTISPKHGFRIIAINNNIAYIYNWWLAYKPEDPAGQLQWLADTLLEAEKNREIVHILGHMPSGSPQAQHTWSKEYCRIINRFSHIIAAQFNGHTHNDEFNVFYHPDDDEKIINIAWNGGSVTTYADLNPNYRTYSVNARTYEVEDADTWIYNITEANLTPNKRPNWYQLYTFKDEYDLKNLSKESIHDLIVDMTKGGARLNKYHKNFHKHAEPALKKDCNEDCLQEHVCTIVTSTSNDKSNCKQWKKLPLIN